MHRSFCILLFVALASRSPLGGQVLTPSELLAPSDPTPRGTRMRGRYNHRRQVSLLLSRGA